MNAKPNLRKLDTGGLIALANQLLNQKRHEEALPVLKRLVEIAPKSAEFRAGLGAVYLGLGQPLEAAKIFRESLDLSTDRPLPVLTNLAVALTARGAVPDAVPVLEEMYARGVQDPGTLGSLIDCLIAAEDEARLLEVLRQAVEMHPHVGQFHRALAIELEASGRVEDAIVAARRAYELLPNDFVVRDRLTALLKKADHLPEAVAVLRRALADDFARSVFHARLYDCLLKLYPGDALVPALERMLEDTPQDDAVRYQLARALFERRELPQAARVMEGIGAGVRETPIAQELFARLALAAGDSAQAIAVYHGIWDLIAALPADKDVKMPAVPRSKAPINPVVYLPIEIPQRELASRVLIACYGAAAGLHSVIGPSHTLTAGLNVPTSLPPGIFLEKTMYKIDREKVFIAMPGGHRFAAIDEEAMGRAGTDRDILLTADPKIVPHLDLIFVCGKRHAVAYGTVFPEFANRVRATGNPRLDLLAPPYRRGLEAEIAKYRGLYGNFVLVCTNFASVNSNLWSFYDLLRNFSKVVRSEGEDERFRQSVIVGKSAVTAECEHMRAFEREIPLLAAQIPEITFVIRGHPFESTDQWRHLAAQCPNVVIDSSGSLQAVMAAARAVVYVAGCATGLESTLAGHPSINMMTNPDLAFPKYVLSSFLNEAGATAGELAALVRKALTVPAGAHVSRPEDAALLAENFTLSDREPAAKRVADGLAEIYAARGRGRSSDRAWLTDVLRKVLAPAANHAARMARRDEFMARKRVLIAPAEIEHLVAISREAFAIPGDIAVTALSEESVMVSPAT